MLLTLFFPYVQLPLNLCVWQLGKDQVAVGLAPIGFANKSSESALSIYPIAIGNCKEKRLVTNDNSGLMIIEHKLN